MKHSQVMYNGITWQHLNFLLPSVENIVCDDERIAKNCGFDWTHEVSGNLESMLRVLVLGSLSVIRNPQPVHNVLVLITKKSMYVFKNL